MRPRLRVFISSPGDVPEERLRAHLVVQKLARDYARFFQIEPYLWEHEPMLASGHFQDAIEPPSECDVVVLVVYARLGTALPERTTLREYRGIDGRAPVTGTEWEFEEALAANRSGGAPDLLAYRKLGDPGASLVDAERRAEQERQWTALESFWRRHFEGAGIFLAGSAKFRTLEEFDQKLESDLKTLIEGKIAERMREQAGLEDAHWFRGSPFRGLAAYDFDDAPVFFGRDAQIRAAMTRLHGAARGGTAFLLVLGASGSGKSSLVRAGLLPALVAPKAVPGVGVWRRVVLRPGDGGEDPVLGLAKALVAGQADAGEGLPELLFGGGDPKALAAHLQAAADDPSFPFQQALSGVADRARSAGGLLPFETAKLVLVIDQLEELFTRAIDPERRALFARILAGLARSGAVWVVGTMRNDLWHRAAELPQLVGLVEAGARLDLPQPDGAEVIEIVRRPAAAAGIAFESDPESGVGLDAVMARAANEEPGALPLLSVMLDSLYERDVAPGAGRMLTFASYRELGELRGAIARRAEQTLAALRASDPEAAAALPQLLRALVTASGEGTATSRPADLAGFPPGSPAARLIEAFVAPDARLLVTTMSGGRAEVRLAHEALLENWPAARDQIATDRRDLQTRARLEALHGRWNAAGGRAERKDALLTGLNLAEGADLVRRWGIPRDTGLGAFVAQSQAAERWRRQSLAAAAVVLLAVFAAIAGLATLQWQRAERQTLLARQAEDTEREARAGAEAARTEAVAERDRADREKTRALAALRETKREAARSLALQSTLATGRDEVRRGLTLAVQAARAERDVLDPGETPASEPALLGALGEMREVAHLVMPPESWTNVPHDFLGDTRLVVADPQNGVTVLDLETRGTVLSVKLPERVLPTAVRALPEAGLIVAAGVRTFFVIDAATGAMRGEIAFKDRIADLDVHEGSRKAVVAVGAGIGVIDLAAPALPELVPVPDANAGVVVGQVRFAAGGRSVLVGYGTAVLAFDPAAGTYGATRAELTAEASGLDRALVEAVNAKGMIILVGMHPVPEEDRVLLSSVMELRDVNPATGEARLYERPSRDATMLGVGFADQGRVGRMRETIAVTSRATESGQEIALHYASEGKLTTFERFRISAADLNQEKVSACRISLHAGYVACQYRGKQRQGLFVWALQGGRHRLDRIGRRTYSAGSGTMAGAGEPRLLLGSAEGLSWAGRTGAEPPAAWGPDWRLEPASGAFVPARSAAGRVVQVLRADADGRIAPVFGPVEGERIALDGASGRALVSGADRLALHGLADGRRLWTAPGLADLVAAGFVGEGAQVVALTPEAAYLFDAATGRLVASHPLALGEGRVAAIGPRGAQIAYLDAAGLQLVDLASGRIQPVAPGLKGGVRLAFAPDGTRLYVALDDGRVMALDPAGAVLWTASSPTEGEMAVSAWPGQPPRGTILDLAVSADGRRLALVRQDIPAIDIRETRAGAPLTQISTPWAYGVPTGVSFQAGDAIVAGWSVHALVREKTSGLSAHLLPRGFDDVLALAETRLAGLAPVTAERGAPARSN